MFNGSIWFFLKIYLHIYKCKINFGEVQTELGVRGITPWKTHHFLPSIMVILVNFLEFVNFFPSYFSTFFFRFFFEGAPHHLTPVCIRACLHIQKGVNLSQHPWCYFNNSVFAVYCVFALYGRFCNSFIMLWEISHLRLLLIGSQIV